VPVVLAGVVEAGAAHQERLDGLGTLETQDRQATARAIRVVLTFVRVILPRPRSDGRSVGWEEK
jgi:hypothetical protein